MNLIEFKRALRQLVDKSIKDKTDRQTFTRQMNIIAEKYLGNDAYKSTIIDSITKEYDFANSKTLLQTDKIIIDDLFLGLTPEFAKTKKGIIKEVANIVNSGIKSNEFTKEIQMRLESTIGKYRNYAATITNTALAGYDNLSKHKGDPDNSLYLYTGPPPQRSFCRSIIGKTFTKEQIKKLNNGQGLDVWTYNGGFFCRHFFLRVK